MADENVVFSIIVPCYNSSKYLERCVNSIQSQTYDKWECILVDDGSNDETPVISDSLVRSDRRLFVIHKNNGGVSSARNAGLKKAIGKYVIFIDSDDWIPDDTLQVYSQYIDDHDFIRCSHALIENGNIVSYVSAKGYSSKESYLRDIISYKEINRGIVFGCYARSLFTENNIEFKEDIVINEDYLVLFYLLKYSQNSCFLGDVLYFYDIGNNASCCHSMNLDKDIQFFEVHKIIYADSFVLDRKWEKYKNQGEVKSMYDIEKRLLHSEMSPSDVCDYLNKLQAYYPSFFSILTSNMTYKTKIKLLLLKYFKSNEIIKLLQNRAHHFE